MATNKLHRSLLLISPILAMVAAPTVLTGSHRCFSAAAGDPQSVDSPVRQPCRCGDSHRRQGASANRQAMSTVRALVHDYRHAIERESAEIDRGIRSVTRIPSDPEGARALIRHVEEMKSLIDSGGRIRGWDPLFAAIFDHAAEIQIEVEKLADGVRVTETSDNPRVVELIRAHARKVDEFIRRGPEAVHEPTEVPTGYLSTPDS